MLFAKNIVDNKMQRRYNSLPESDCFGDNMWLKPFYHLFSFTKNRLCQLGSPIPVWDRFKFPYNTFFWCVLDGIGRYFNFGHIVLSIKKPIQDIIDFYMEGYGSRLSASVCLLNPKTHERLKVSNPSYVVDASKWLIGVEFSCDRCHSFWVWFSHSVIVAHLGISVLDLIK